MSLEKFFLRLFLSFLFFYGLVVLLLWVSPFQGRGVDGYDLLFINVVFISLFYLPAIFILAFTPNNSVRLGFSGKQITIIKNTVKLCFWFSLLGICLIAYDRILVRGIDYSLGLRAARYQWLNSSGGNIFGVFGNLLIPTAYVGLFLLIQHSGFFRLKPLLFFLICFFSFVIFHSMLNGGRSNVLLALFVLFFSFILKEDKIDFRLAFRFLIIAFLFLLPAVIYVFNVTKSSAVMGGAAVSELLQLGAGELYGELKDGRSISNYSEMLSLFNYSFIYLIHGQWTMGIFLSDGVAGGSYFLYPFSVFLSRLLPFEPLDTGRFSDTGAFIALPGAIYYDFGLFGFVLVSLGLSSFFGFLLVLLRRRDRVGGVKLSFVIYFLFLFMLAPVIPAFGFSYLSFIAFAFFFVGLVNFFIYGRGARML